MKIFNKNEKVRFTKFKISKNSDLEGVFQIIDVPVKNRNSSIRNTYKLFKVDENGKRLNETIYPAVYRNLIKA